MGGFVLSDFLPYQLSVLADRASREFAAVYQERFGLSVPEWRVLAHLSQVSGPVSVREIHARVGMDKSRVSRAASRLARRGLLIKSVSAADRRLLEMSLSGAGREMMRELAPLAEDFQRRFLAGLEGGEAGFRVAMASLLAAGDGT